MMLEVLPKWVESRGICVPLCQVVRTSAARLAAIVCVLTLLAGCTDDKADAPAPQARLPVVQVARVHSAPVALYSELPARIEASEKVEISTRVEGLLEEQLFTEGSAVTAGQVLFRLEKAPLEAALHQAQADLEGAEGQARQTRSQLARGRRLLPRGYISQADLESLVSKDAQAQAAVAARKAALEQAQLNLAFAEIQAPFSGQTGAASYSVGSLVGPAQGTLVELVRLDPVRASFQLTQQEVLDYRLSHKGNMDGALRFEARLKLPGGTEYQEPGTIDFTAPEVDEKTGTVEGRAVFRNADHLLLPGMYVTLILESSEKKSRVLVPQIAVHQELQGRSVLVVDSDNKVHRRALETGRRLGAFWAVRSGLDEGERVVLTGAQSVRAGAQVTPVNKQVDRETGAVTDVVGGGGSQDAATEKRSGAL